MNRRMIFTERVKNQPALVEIPASSGLKTLPSISLKKTDTTTNPMIREAEVKNTTG